MVHAISYITLENIIQKKLRSVVQAGFYIHTMVHKFRGKQNFAFFFFLSHSFLRKSTSISSPALHSELARAESGRKQRT